MPPLTAPAYAHYLRGRAAFFEADYARALAELDEAAAAAPDQAGIAVARAEAMARLGRRVDAGKDIDRATARWPDAAEVWLASGDIHRGAGELKSAAAAYRRALALDHGLADAYLGLAATETQAQRPEVAERVYRDLIAALPENVDGHEHLAQILLARGDDAGAAPYLTRVLELDGDRLDSQRALAGVHVRAGRLADAIAATRLAFDRSGGDLAIGADLVWLLLEGGDRRGALDVLALYDDSSPAELQADVATLYLAMGELGRALEAAEAAAARGRDTSLVRARVLIALGRTTEALAAVDGIAAGRKAWPAAQALAVDALLGAGRVAEARSRADTALARAPSHVGVVAAAAEAARQGGDPAAGRAAFRLAAAERPHDSDLALAWASFEARTGDRGRSLGLAELVLAATPDSSGALNQVGFTLVELGRDLPRARRVLTRARGLAPGDPSVLDSWGWLLRAEGDLAGADRALSRATWIAPHEAEILVHAATVAQERGGRGRAARLLALARRRPGRPRGPRRHRCGVGGAGWLAAAASVLRWRPHEDACAGPHRPRLAARDRRVPGRAEQGRLRQAALPHHRDRERCHRRQGRQGRRRQAAGRGARVRVGPQVHGVVHPRHPQGRREVRPRRQDHGRDVEVRHPCPVTH